jgi:PAS domain S-box-containing protein/putative nucleotidyltransferase with HDIG domain
LEEPNTIIGELAMENRVYRLLVLEDFAPDAELVVRELREAGVKVDWIRVDSAEGFENALRDFVPEIILADYSLPQFDALAALDIYRESGMHVPFILVTGTQSEEVAVACIKKGADDYVLKSSLRRLPAAVANALEKNQAERERSLALSALRHREAMYRLITDNTRDLIAIIGLNGKFIYTSPSFKEVLGYDKTELDNTPVFELIHPSDGDAWRDALSSSSDAPTIVISHRFRHKDGSWRTFGSSLRWATDEDPKTEDSAVVVSRDITDRVAAEEVLKSTLDKLRRTVDGTVSALAATAERRDPYTAGHQRRVMQLACAIGREMGLSDDQIEGIRVAAMLHDLGKIYIPAEILNKPGMLSEIEFGMIRTHSEVGYDILRTIEFPWPIADMVLQHHERMDGSGYPTGIKGDAIMVEARILAVADVVEAMASHRPYRPALGIQEALEEINAHKDQLYDPAVVEACNRVFDHGQFIFD